MRSAAHPVPPSPPSPPGSPPGGAPPRDPRPGRGPFPAGSRPWPPASADGGPRPAPGACRRCRTGRRPAVRRPSGCRWRPSWLPPAPACVMNASAWRRIASWGGRVDLHVAGHLPQAPAGVDEATDLQHGVPARQPAEGLDARAVEGGLLGEAGDQGHRAGPSRRRRAAASPPVRRARPDRRRRTCTASRRRGRRSAGEPSGMRTRHRSGRPMKSSTLRSMPFSAIQRAKVS